MPFIEAGSCEPLRVFTRLEPRLRETEFDDALAARVHDPMFLLARQWQFGEFAGEDGGSAVFATLARRVTPVAGDGLDGGLEPAVEALPYDLPLLQRVRLGRTLATRVDEALTGTPGYDPALARTLLARVFGPLDTAPAETVAAARDRAAPRRARVRAAVAGRVDGLRAFAALTPGMTAAALPAGLLEAVPPAHLPGYLSAFESYRAWFAATFVPDAGRWHTDQLEYQYAATAGPVGLDAVEHTGARLDWYGADLVTGPDPAAPAGTTDVRTVIPNPAEFPGMPKPRWWQFEDGAVDLGRLRADTTDAARIVVSEFVLLYGNNWFVVTCRQPVGTLARLDGVVVSDVFGWRTLVSAAPPGSDWTGWDLFGLAGRGSGPAVQAIPQHLYVPAALGHVIDGEPLESVVFVRDEGADMVWAVEQRVTDGTGGSRDGAEAARRLRAELEPPEPGPPVRRPGLRYVAQTDVAENWIPFIPVHQPDDTRAIRLQRSAIARTVPPVGSPIRPATSLLRTGIADDDSHAAPMFLNEEEVPRAGVVVTSRMRRARRFDGTPVVWHARSVATGRGGGRSGLAFDRTEQTP